MNRLLIFTIFMLKGTCYCQIPDSTVVNGEKIATKLLNEVTISPLQLDYIERLSYFRLQKKGNQLIVVKVSLFYILIQMKLHQRLFK